MEKTPPEKRIKVKLTSFKNIITVYWTIVFTILLFLTREPVWGYIVVSFLGLVFGANQTQKYIKKTKK